MAPLSFPDRNVAVYVIERRDPERSRRLERFVRSYMQFRAGVQHELVVVPVGFASEADLAEIRTTLALVTHREIRVGDQVSNIAAYGEALRHIECRGICFLGSSSEILDSDWLLKLALNLYHSKVGLVGVTGSFERGLGDHFPNIHVRTSAFMLRSEHARSILGCTRLSTDEDCCQFEHGRNGLTHQILAMQLDVLVVGRNGRGYPPRSWSGSRTFRQGDQSNLLVEDEETRRFQEMTWNEKMRVHQETWGSRLGQRDALIYPTP